MSLAGSLEINRSIQSLAPSAVVTLWVLDASAIPNGPVMRFCAQTSQDQEAVVWQGATYNPLPVEVKGFEIKGQGSPPRPTIVFGNVGGAIGLLCRALGDLVGAKLVRKRTQARYLDGMPGANPANHFPDDVFTIERKSAENKFAVEFELGTAMDVEDVELPKRQILGGICLWRYRGGECGFATETVVAKRDGTAFPTPKVNKGIWTPSTMYTAGDFAFLLLPDGRRQYYRLASGSGVIGADTKPGEDARWEADDCGKHTADCKLRFGAVPNGLPFGGFPAAQRQS